MLKNLKELNKVINQLMVLLNSKQKKTALIVFVSMIITSFLELLGVSIIYPFLQLVISPASIRNNFYLKWLYIVFPSISDRMMLITIGISICVVFLVKNAVALWFVYLQSKFSAYFQRDASTEMLDAYMKKSYLYFVNTNSAELIRGINVDTTYTYNILLYIFQMIGEILTVILLGIFLIRTDWMIAIGSLVVVGICSILIVLGFKTKIKQAGIQYRSAAKDRNQYSYQAINGIKEITVLDRREMFVGQFYRAAQKMADASLTNMFFAAAPDRILEGVCIAGLMGVICLRIAFGVELDTFIPAIGTFAMGAFKILPSMSKISSRINGIVYNMSGLNNCYEIITSSRMGDGQGDSIQYVKDEEITIEKGFSGSLRIENVTWKYPNADQAVLCDLSLSINKGESVAFIGASGAGKTTLADIIMGLLHPMSGTVAADGADIYSMPHRWSKIIGYVPQSVFLIDDTIRANIAFGIPKNDVHEDKVWEALEQAQLKVFVESLPKGLDTIVGERGVKLSGGQRQRIAIARALYEDPDILVLDEATSALDTETETAVMESIDLLQGRKTLIIVAHRLTTIKNCDKIYEIADGKAILRDKSEVFK